MWPAVPARARRGEARGKEVTLRLPSAKSVHISAEPFDLLVRHLPAL